MKSTKIILRLSDLLLHMGSDIGATGEEAIYSFCNMDDIFVVLRKRGIKEVKVNLDQMLMIVRFMFANLKDGEDEFEDKKWDGYKLIREGETDSFLGVKLFLE